MQRKLYLWMSCILFKSALDISVIFRIKFHYWVTITKTRQQYSSWCIFVFLDAIFIFIVADNQLTDAQYKRQSPPSGQKSTDAGQRTSSIKSINTRAVGAPSGGSGSNDEPTMAGGQILSLLLDLSRNMAAMSDVINEIRFQNHVTYRQLKRIQLQQGKCIRAYSSMTSSHAATGYQPMKPEMGQKLQSFAKSGNSSMWLIHSTLKYISVTFYQMK